ncbi:putative 3-ketoacyl-acyl carrier protein reductase [Zopfia rhizophila CBS 207.26]|uniref:Putative 3-ketoacyl-acyl carrier protein reductase n=1 Tax=Zopfia rhizophila CBS 207.26 TaxID=1314779 RepID=A0A6A6DWT5_9PEZI|nr:putative 3-ketoacyl-acyl carrier protein reductase [Zopfia rhizophila CBS 207.26]
MSSSSIDNNLAGRLALITGASGGVKNLVVSLIQEYERTYPNRQPPRSSVHKADLSDVEETLGLCEEAKSVHEKPVDILIANAGFGRRITDIEDIPLDVFEHTINVNLRAPFLLAKSVAGGMKAQRWGRIVFISSISGYGVGLNGCRTSPTPLDANALSYILRDYAASKGGLTSMMKNLSTRLAEYNITANDVSPAMIGETGLLPSGDSVPGLVDSIPLGRLGTPQEVANVVTMFCTTGYITGQSVVLAGGLNHK